MISAKTVLTDKRVAGLKEIGRYPDARVPGLCFQISKTGGRSWVLRYSVKKRDRMMGLGRADLLNVESARERARNAWRLILDGTDPLTAREQQVTAAAAPATITFEEAAERFIKSHEPGWKNKKHGAQWRATLTAYVYPIIGALGVNQIGTAEVMNVLEQDYPGGKTLWTAIPETASRVRQRVEAVLGWAKARGYRTGENPAHWRGHLDKLLPARGKVAKVKHHPALPYSEIPVFMAGLRKRRGISARALELTILTACRTNELTKSRRTEIDWKAKVWTVPPERMKAEKEHRVPLTDRAIQILEALPVEEGNPYLFIGTQTGKPLSNAAMAEMMKEIAAPSTTPGRIATVHGMRSTFRDWAGEMTNFPRELAEAALAHTLDSEVEAAYQRGDMLLKRRKLMEAWAASCASPARKGEVVPMRKKA